MVLTKLQLQERERRPTGPREPMAAWPVREPPPPGAKAGRPTRWLLSPPAILVLAMAALVVLVPPAGEFAIDDDWGYARIVQILVDQGRLEIHPWVAASVVLQAYWGGLFAHLFGFSHTALRASTLVLAAAGVLGFYLLLRDLLGPGRALLGALLLLVNPLHVFLAYSFMTEVPFQCLAIWALVCYVRALQEPSASGAGSANPPDGATRRPGLDSGGRVEPGRSLRWLAAGSVLAGGAYLVRQIGVALPLAALGGLLLGGGWRLASRPGHLMAVLGPFLPAVLLGAYFDEQRGSVRQVPVAWMLDFWMQQGPGMVGVVLDRLVGTFTRLGLYTLPLSIGILLGGPAGWLGPSQRRWPVVALPALLAVGLVVHTVTFKGDSLFPYLNGFLSPHGFFGDPGYWYRGTAPGAIVIPESVLNVVTALALLGGALLTLAIGAVVTRQAVRGPTAVPLLFGLIALGVTLLYYSFSDDYLLALLPSALLVAALAFRRTTGCCALALAGLALLAAWSVWWEREYLERRAAIWQAGLALVERGIPPQEINGGFEWNGWYLGEVAIAAAVQQAPAGGDERRLQGQILRILKMRDARWALAFASPRDAADRVLAVLPYWSGQRVFAIEHDWKPSLSGRCRDPVEPAPSRGASAEAPPDTNSHGADRIDRFPDAPPRPLRAAGRAPPCG